MATISVFNYLQGNTYEERIDKDESVVYAEDLIFKMASQLLDLNPVGVHLFALYHPKLDLWLCPNQKLSQLQDEKLPDLNFQLKIRFVPVSALDLYRRDPNAFEYYFYQERNDFINFPKRYIRDGFESEAYGIALQDVLRIVIEKKMSVDDIKGNIKKIVLEIYEYLPKNMPNKIFDSLFPIKDKLEESFMDSYSKNHNVNYVKSCYINQFVKNIAGNYYDETYDVIYYNPKHSLQLKKKASFLYEKQSICLRSNKNETWEPLFTLKDLMYITVLSNNLIQISHVNGAPVNFTFETNLKMKSFISLLAGYYRLSQRWNFEICKDHFSPWIDQLRRINCHGPVNKEFVKEKLNKFCDEGSNHNPFIFYQSSNSFTTFFISFKDKHYTVVVDLRKAVPDFFLEEQDQHFVSHQKLFEFIRSIWPKASVLIPSESDFPASLLLCRHKDEPMKRATKHELNVVPADQVEKSKLLKMQNKLFCIRYGDIKNGEKVMIKEFVNNNTVGQHLREISEWIHLQDSSIVNCKGIIISPFSVLFEFCQTSLQDLYNEHQAGLKTYLLIQAAYFLAKALDYIYSKEFRHGFIRFENLYVSHFSEKSLQIKLGDPICNLNLHVTEEVFKDRHWFPTEFFDPSHMLYRQLTSYVDVWAFGTTLWQIFNKGQRPASDVDFRAQSSLSSHNSVDIPPEVAKLIDQCRHQDYGKRMQPYSIFGDMSRILSATYEAPTYQRISNFHSDSVPQYLNHYYNNTKARAKDKSFLSKFPSISSLSLSSGQTDITSLNQNEDTISTVFSIASSRDLYEIEKIDGNQLSAFKQIGHGNYGFVYKAHLEKHYEKENTTVAIKVIPESETKSLDNEIGIMTKLKHKNIVQIIGYCYIEKHRLPNEASTSQPNGKFKGLVMEFLQLGSLNNYLKEKFQKGQLELPFNKFASDIAEGLVFLASKNIIHRDLAARNILVKSEVEVKISDFGLSHIVEDDFYRLQSDRLIPLKWYAPESITHHIFRTKSDVWSYGVLLWEMYTFCKTDPFDNIPNTELHLYLKKGNRLQKPANCPQAVYTIMEKCWNYEVEARPDFEQVFDEIQRLTNSN